MIEWRPVPGWEGLYEVCCDGRIRSLQGRNYLREKSQVLVSGYLRVALYQNPRKAFKSVHRIVAEAFIPNPDNKPEVNHKNGIKTDNRVENLEWVTSKENHEHAVKNGFKKDPIKMKCRPVAAFNKETLEVTKYFSASEAARELGLCSSEVCVQAGKNTAYKKACKISKFYFLYIDEGEENGEETC